MTISLADLDVDPCDDAGTCWHPRPDKSDVRCPESGDLLDLSSDEVEAHRLKPEAADQLDAAAPLAAEDSDESPDDEV